MVVLKNCSIIKSLCFAINYNLVEVIFIYRQTEKEDDLTHFIAYDKINIMNSTSAFNQVISMILLD
jgi:hypothetical protein